MAEDLIGYRSIDQKELETYLITTLINILAVTGTKKPEKTYTTEILI